MKMTVTLLLAITLPFYVFAQTQFTHGWRMNCETNRNTFQQTSDGGYIICGTIQVPASLIPQCYLMKADSNGHQQWMTQFPIGSQAYSNVSNASVCQTIDGGYTIATSFFTGLAPAGSSATYLVRTDSAGNLLWARTYSGAGNSFSYCINRTTDNGFIVAGTTQDSISTLHYAYLLRTDSVGGVLWSTCYWPQNEDVTPSCAIGAKFYSASQTSDGGFIVSGIMNADSTQGSIVMKTDSGGNIIWSQGCLGPSLSYVIDFDVQELPNGDFIACGEDYTTDYGATLTRFSPSGVPLWRKTYGTVIDIPFSSFLVANSVTTNANGFTFSVGEPTSPGDPVRLMHTDTAGNPLWTRFYTTTINSVADVEYTSDGGYAFTAYTPGQYTNHILLYKTDSLGRVQCDDSLLNDTAFNVSLPASRPLATMNTGLSIALPTTLSPALMSDTNFCPTIDGLDELLPSVATSVYPNPANDEISVSLSGLQGNHVQMRLFNSMGQQVHVQSAGDVYGAWTTDLNTASYAEGIYFASIEVDGIPIEAVKVLIQH